MSQETTAEPIVEMPGAASESQEDAPQVQAEPAVVTAAEDDAEDADEADDDGEDDADEDDAAEAEEDAD